MSELGFINPPLTWPLRDTSGMPGGVAVEVIDQVPPGIGLVAVNLYNSLLSNVFDSAGSPVSLQTISGQALSPGTYWEFMELTVANVLYVSVDVPVVVAFSDSASGTALPVASWYDPLRKVRKITGLNNTTVRVQCAGYTCACAWSAVRVQLSTNSIILP